MKNPKENTIFEINESEFKMVKEAVGRYGDYFNLADETLRFLSFCYELNNAKISHQVFIVPFLAAFEQYLKLAILLATRRHHVQCNYNLRLATETFSWICYSLHTDKKEDFYKKNEINILEENEIKKVYEWLDKNFKAESDRIKGWKKLINDSTSHANLTYSSLNYDFKNGIHYKTFFDRQDSYFIVKQDLFAVANICLEFVLILEKININYNVLVFKTGYKNTHNILMKRVNTLKEELKNTTEPRKGF